MMQCVNEVSAGWRTCPASTRDGLARGHVVSGLQDGGKGVFVGYIILEAG